MKSIGAGGVGQHKDGRFCKPGDESGSNWPPPPPPPWLVQNHAFCHQQRWTGGGLPHFQNGPQAQASRDLPLVSNQIHEPSHGGFQIGPNPPIAGHLQPAANILLPSAPLPNPHQIAPLSHKITHGPIPLPNPHHRIAHIAPLSHKIAHGQIPQPNPHHHIAPLSHKTAHWPTPPEPTKVPETPPERTEGHETTKSKCRKCGTRGHKKTECTTEVLCAVCGKDTHATNLCAWPSHHKPVAKFVGFGAKGKGFYWIQNAKSHKNEVNEAMAAVAIESGNFSKDELEDLKNSSFKLNNWKSSVSVIDTTYYEAVAKAKLNLICVKVEGVPHDLKTDYFSLCEIGSALGVVQEIDMHSARTEGEVKIKVWVRSIKDILITKEMTVIPYVLTVSFKMLYTVEEGWDRGDEGGSTSADKDEELEEEKDKELEEEEEMARDRKESIENAKHPREEEEQEKQEGEKRAVDEDEQGEKLEGNHIMERGEEATHSREQGNDEFQHDETTRGEEEEDMDRDRKESTEESKHPREEKEPEKQEGNHIMERAVDEDEQGEKLESNHVVERGEEATHPREKGNEKTHFPLMKEGTNGVANSTRGNGKTGVKEGTQGGSCPIVQVSTIMDVELTSLSGEKTSSPLVKEPGLQVSVMDVEATSKSGEEKDTAGGLLSRTGSTSSKSTDVTIVYRRKGKHPLSKMTVTNKKGSEKGTPPLKVLKDTTGMRKRACMNDVRQRHVRPKLNVDEQHQGSETPINALRRKGKHPRSKDEPNIVENPTIVKEINNQSDTSKMTLANKKALQKGTPRLQVVKDTTEPWLSTPKPSPDSGMIKRSYINDVGQRHARQKLNLDEEPHGSETPMGALSLRTLTRVKYTNMDEDTSKALNPLAKKVYHFMKNVRPIIGKDKENVRSITEDTSFLPWKETIVTSVVGAFLTQHATDRISSDAFMEIAARFYHEYSENKFSSPTSHHCSTNGRGAPKFHDLLDSFRNDYLIKWKEDDIKNVLNNTFEKETAHEILQDILFIQKTDTSCWEGLQGKAQEKGHDRNNDEIDPIDWEAVLNGSFDDIKNCIEKRGEHIKIAFRLLAFLIRIKKDNGHTSLEFLKHIDAMEAKEYLLSIRGLGNKCVNCIMLLSLRAGGFPVDSNVSRIAVRLQWVPLAPLHPSVQFHEITRYPPEEDIYAYIWPCVSSITTEHQSEVHRQLITFGKIICTKIDPNCDVCPFTSECKYYGSKNKRSKLDIGDIEDIGTSRISLPVHTKDRQKAIKREKTATKHIVYIIPDKDIILEKFGKFDARLHEDPNYYLLLVHNNHTKSTKGTILIPHYTALKGIFPLNGTFFKENEVFADHSSSHTPIEISSTDGYDTTTVYFGSSIGSIARDQRGQKDEMTLNEGYICVRGFDPVTRRPHPLCDQLVAINVKLPATNAKKGRKGMNAKKNLSYIEKEKLARRNGSMFSNMKGRKLIHSDASI